MAGILELLDQQAGMAQDALEETARSQTRRDISNIEQKAENVAALGQIAGTIGSYMAINKQLKKQTPATKVTSAVPDAVTPAVDERPVHAGNAMLVGNVYRSLLGPPD